MKYIFAEASEWGLDESPGEQRKKPRVSGAQKRKESHNKLHKG